MQRSRYHFAVAGASLAIDTTLRALQGGVNMWNDTDTPLAYFISFRCYGTWLHGDKRGSIDRFNNRYRAPYIEPNTSWRCYNAENLAGEPVLLDESRRSSVETAVRETCLFRNWNLHVVNARTNHVHVVVSIGS